MAMEHQMAGMPMDAGMHHPETMRVAELSETAETVMSKHDILNRLATHDTMDEMMVANKYLDYAHALEKSGCPELAGKFVEMAHEEFTHARFQRDLLLESGYTMTDGGEEYYHDLKERFHHLA